MSQKITIRPARPDDAEAIHAALLGIGDTIGGAHKIKSTPQDIRRDGFGPDARFSTLIAEIETRFAGMCLSFPIYSTWMGKPGAYVQDLYVAQDFRGLKVGEALLRALARQVRDSGGAYIELAVDTGNLAAQRFYQRLGITHRSDDQIHRITGEDFLAFAAQPNSQEDR